MIYEGFEGFEGFERLEGFEGFEGVKDKREKPLTSDLRPSSFDLSPSTSPPYIYDQAIGLGP